MTSRIKLMMMIAIFIGGFASLATELLVMRQLSSFVGSTAVTASIIIGIIMAFMSWGYYQGSVVSLRGLNLRRSVFLTFLIIGVLIIISASFVLISIYFYAFEAMGIKSTVSRTFLYCLLFLSLPSFLFGRLTSLLSRYLHKYNRNYTGRIMAIDTIGSVLGSILSTLVLMPLIGVNYTVVLVVGLCLLGGALFSRRLVNFYWLCLVLGAGIMFNRSSLLYDIYNIVEDNAVSTISIVSADNGQSKIMIQNDAQASKVSSDEKLLFGYIRYIQKNFLETLPQGVKHDILILGAGGFTLGMNDDFNNYTYIDIDSSLQPIAEQEFLQKPLGKNKQFVVNDAYQFLKETDKEYDLIILDTYSSVAFPPFDLVTKEYFSRVKKHIKDSGIVVANIISHPSFGDAFSRNLDNTIRDVFTHNLSRHTIGNFNPWQATPNLANNIYVWYNYPDSQEIYSANKNRMFLDK